MNPNKIIIRFDQVAEQVHGPVRRLTGFVKAKHLLPLFDAADVQLEANPREPKAGPVTDDIIESILDTPDLYPFKSKGLLLGSSDYDALQRNRYEFRFENPRIEGVLDGGHNMLAIGTYILVLAAEDTDLQRKIKRWPDLKEQWAEHREEIDKLRKASGAEGEGQGSSTPGVLDFLVPVEALVPANKDDEDTIAEFKESLLSICAARNNNAELTLETKANKKGYYEDLRKALPPAIQNRIEWKTNDGGKIKVRDLLALTWIPLSLVELPTGIKFNPVHIYSNKGECAKNFDELMSDESVSKPTEGQYTHELHNVSVHSALVVAGQIPKLYDKIYKEFPAAYNATPGSFGKISCVKPAKDMRSKPETHFTGEKVDYAYPDGLIMPLVFGLRALMERDAKGRVGWKEDPAKFLDKHLGTIVKKYRVILDAHRFDPQKVGKSQGSYDLALDAFETELLKQRGA